MSSSLKNIVIVGGGGRIGQVVLQGLIAAPELNITAVKRPGSTSTFPTAPNLRVVESESTLDSLASVFEGQDAVISVVGGTGFGAQKVMVDAALKSGVKRFFPSEFGINGQSEVTKQVTPFFAVKQELLDYLVEKEKDGLTWTGLICGVLLDWCLSNGFIGFDFSSKKAVIWDDGNTRFSATRDADLGQAVVASLEHAAETANKFVFVSSVATTQNEILEAAEKATSTKWAVTKTTTQEQLDSAREALAKGDFSGAFIIVKATCLGNVPGHQQHFEAEEKDRLESKLLGIKVANIQEVVDTVLASGEFHGAFL